MNEPPFIAGMERVTSYQEANEILRSAEFGAGGFEQESWPFRGRTLLEVDGEEHARRRKLEAPLFASRTLDGYEERILEPAIERCLEEADGNRGDDGLVRADLVWLTRRMFLQIAAAVIGLDGVDTPARTDVLERCMYALNAAFDVKYSTRDHAEVVAEGLAAKQRFIEEFFRPSAKRRAGLIERSRRGETEESDLPTDLLTLMLKHHDSDWDDDLPARESILYMAGATETTSNAVTHAVVDLLNWLQDHPEDRGLLDDSGFLRGVCNEALRLHSNVIALARRAERDTVLTTGRRFRSGAQVAVYLADANRDPEAFGPDAAQFNPRRQVAAGIRPYGLIFGAGRHVCVGLPMTTTVSGKPAGEGESDRMMLKILKALLAAGIEIDRSKSPEFLPTIEQVYISLPVLFRAR